MNNVKISLLCWLFCSAVSISWSISDSEWDSYKKKFNKMYRNLDDELVHKNNYEKNVEKITRHNIAYTREDYSYKLGINQFTDLDDNEILQWKSRSCTDDSLLQDNNMNGNKYSRSYAVPASLDWREFGIVSEVKDIGKSKKDWALTAIGLLEAHLYKKTNNFTPLNEQELIICSIGSVRETIDCQGMNRIRSAIMHVGRFGISTNTSDPFDGEMHSCARNNSRNEIWSNLMIQHIKDREYDMKFILFRYGPLAAKIYAPPSFFFYQEGIFTGKECLPENTILDYNVLIVGYNTTPKNEEYWIVKNWMGQGWGEQGYVKIARNKNTCGIAGNVLAIPSEGKNRFYSGV